MLRSNRFPPLASSDILYICLSLAIGFGIGSRNIEQLFRTQASSVQAAASPLSPPGPAPVYKDIRVAKLAAYLKEKNSPLEEYAEYIVKEADRYDIGWTKIAAISGMESAYGTDCPEGSYNAWGLGGEKFMYFESWKDSIHYVSALLGGSYKRREIEAVKEKYCPSSDNCNPRWSGIVSEVSERILSIAP